MPAIKTIKRIFYFSDDFFSELKENKDLLEIFEQFLKYKIIHINYWYLFTDSCFKPIPSFTKLLLNYTSKGIFYE